MQTDNRLKKECLFLTTIVSPFLLAFRKKKSGRNVAFDFLLAYMANPLHNAKSKDQEPKPTLACEKAVVLRSSENC